MAMSETIATVTRHARRSAQFPDKATCSACGETNPCALVAKTHQSICYECQNKQEGKTGVEHHHIAGRANSEVTVSIPANDHRVLSDWQQEWPASTLRNPDGSPLLGAAAALRGWLDVLKLLIDRALGWIPVCLEVLDTALCEHIDPAWWRLPAFRGCCPIDYAIGGAL